MKSYFETFSIAVPANSIYRLDNYNNFLTLLENDSPTAIKVGIGADAKAQLKKGLSVELPQGKFFKHLIFENITGSTMNIEIALSNGRVYDNRLSVAGSAFDSILGELRGDTTPETWGAEITVGVAAVQIIALNTDRKACIIQAKATNTGIVYIGFDNTVTTTKWIAELLAGMSFSVDDYRGDLYARADAIDQLVGYGEW